MAKTPVFHYTAYLYKHTINIDEPLLLESTATKMVFFDGTVGDRLVVTGTNFKYDHGLLNGGTITGLTETDADGKVIIKVTDFAIEGNTLPGNTNLDFLTSLVVKLTYGNTEAIGYGGNDTILTYFGNDILMGKGGADTLTAGMGKDVLTGGSGSDTFVFAAGDGKDKIMDFDADGLGVAQDYIRHAFPGADHVSQHGKDTFINFDDGDTLTLVNVKATHIDATDFVM